MLSRDSKSLLKNIFLIIILTCSYYQSWSHATQALKFSTIDKSNGLPSNYINDIEKDKYGFIWIATNEGLSRYDGPNKIKTFKVDTISQSNSLVVNHIRVLLSDSKGNLWIGTRDGGLTRYNPSTNSWKTFLKKESNNQTLPHNTVVSLLEDRQNRLWVGTEKGLSLFNSETETFTNYLSGNNGLKGGGVLSLLEDDRGWIWVGTWDGGLHLLLTGEDKIVDSFRHFKLDKSNAKDKIWKIYQDRDGILWVGSFGCGLFTVKIPVSATNQKNAQNWVPDFNNFRMKQITNDLIVDIMEDSEQNLWVSTVHGLNRLKKPNLKFKSNKETATNIQPKLVFEHYFNELDVNYTIVDDVVNSIHEVADGLLWFGTQKGISQLHQHNRLKIYSVPKKTGGWQNGANMCIDKDGNIWIISYLKGLFKFSTGAGNLLENISSKHPDLVLGNQGYAITTRDSINLFVGTNAGITHINSQTLIAKHFPFPAEFNKDYPNINTTKLFVDDKGLIWLGAVEGLFILNPKTGNYTTHLPKKEKNKLNSNLNINDIYQASDGNIWIGTWTGFYKLSLTNDSDVTFSRIRNDENGVLIPNDEILSITQIDSILYLGSSDGFFGYNFIEKTFESYPSPINKRMIYSIQKTNKNDIWCSTKDEILKFNTQTKSFKSLSELEKYGVNQFRLGSKLIDKQGNLYFGSNKSLVSFHPDDIFVDKKEESIYFTEITAISPKTTKRLNGISQQVINLASNDYYLSVDFATLNHKKVEKKQYFYQLKGFDNAWRPVDFGSPLVFTNLQPNTYQLSIKSPSQEKNSEGKTSTLTIIKHPAFWQTLWFKLLSFLFGLTSILIGLNWFKSNLKKKNAQKLIEEKNHVFANITHEFQTPLSVIQGLSEQLVENDDTNELHLRSLRIISRNARFLSSTINQLTRPIAFKEELINENFALFKLTDFVNFLYPEYAFLASEKEINLAFPSFESTTESLIFTDSEKLVTIIKNLLSNAIKYTQPKGNVCLEYQKDNPAYHIFQIKDNGQGIKEQDTLKIFERYYQPETDSNNLKVGFGLGLAICKEYIDLLKGELIVESELGKGSQFTVKVPKNTTTELTKLQLNEPLYQFPLLKKIEAQSKSTEITQNQEKHNLLIIEDNLDYCFLLDSILKDFYNITFTNSTEDAAKHLQDHHPDLIITDWMMQGMDGLSFVKQLKEKKANASVPILMLTARDIISDKLKALKNGCDDYLVKPVDKKVLLSKIRYLIEQNLTEDLEIEQKSSPYKTQLSGFDSKEQKWLLQLEKFINSKIDNPNLKIDDLVKEMGISQSLLSKKVKMMTGLTVMNYIQELRYWEARRLFEEKQATSVKFACLSVGFKDVKNFSRNFKKRFGKNPSEYIK